LRQPRLGTLAMMAANGIASIMNSIARTFCTSGSRNSATNAGRPLRGRLASEAGFVPTPASRRGDGLPARTISHPHAPSVAQGSTRTGSRLTKRARALAAQSSLVCVGVQSAGRGDVYCLTVPTVGCFSLANGATVSNCADDWRYACMSRPWTPIPQEQPLPRRRYQDRSRAYSGGSWMAA
jgi:hypothetical protein